MQDAIIRIPVHPGNVLIVPEDEHCPNCGQAQLFTKDGKTVCVRCNRVVPTPTSATVTPA